MSVPWIFVEPPGGIAWPQKRLAATRNVRERLVNVLRSAGGGWVTMEAMIEAVYYADGDDEPDYAENTMRVIIASLRKSGFPIVARHDNSYRMEATVSIPLGDMEYDPRSTIGDVIFGRAKPRAGARRP